MIENIFGTDGIRNVVGKFPLTEHDLNKLGHVIGKWAVHRYGQSPCIAIASDTRASASFVKAALSAGLLCESVLIKDLHIVPTPIAAFVVKNYEPINVGIIITASHNPFDQNGIKLVDHRGSKISIEDELHMSACMRDAHFLPSPAHVFGTYDNMPDASSLYCNALTDRFGRTFLKNKLIVLDCAHGAASVIAPHIFRGCGAQVICINNSPDGTNINHQCGALHPEALQRAVIDYQANVGFAFDGDGDRLVVVSNTGDILDGDDILALISEHPRYQNNAVLVGTVMSNQGLVIFAQRKKKQLVRASVGEKNVMQCMLQQETAIGAEPSGHIVILDHLDSSDGIFAALLMLESIILNNFRSMKLFEHYPQTCINVPIQYKKNLEAGNCAAIIEEVKRQLAQGRLVVRYSGTENLLRIMVEAPTHQQAEACAHQLSEKLSQELSYL